MKRHSLILGMLFLIFPLVLPAAIDLDREEEILVEALRVAPLQVVYHDEGGSEESVIAYAGSPIATPLEIRRILALGARALPLLVRHLDDLHATSARFAGGKAHSSLGQPVPLGYICLDVLVRISAPSPRLFQEGFREEELGEGVRPEFYFRPDLDTGSPLSRKIMAEVRANWQQAWKKGWVKRRKTLPGTDLAQLPAK